MGTVRERARKGTRLDIRATDEQKELLVEAAELRHKSLSEFVLECAALEAKRVIEDESRLTIPLEQWKAFNQALDAEPREIPRLKKLLTEKSILER